MVPYWPHRSQRAGKSGWRPSSTALLLSLIHILIETDSPYLTPEPFRGKRNDSSHVHLVAEAIARVKGLTSDEVARITLENGKRFFGIKGGEDVYKRQGWHRAV